MDSPETIAGVVLWLAITAAVCVGYEWARRREFRTVTLAPLRYEARIVDIDAYRPVTVPEFHDAIAEGWLA